MKIVAILLISILSLSAEDTSSDIKKVLDFAVATINSGNLEAHMETMHPLSPNFAVTLKATQAMIDKYKPSVSIIDYKFISVVDEYALIKITQRNEFKQGSHKGTDVVLLHSLKKDKGGWKMWSIMQLEMTALK